MITWLSPILLLWLNTTILGLISLRYVLPVTECVRGDNISNFLCSQRSQVKASFDANRALWSDPSHTEMYSPVSPQVGHETSVSKRVNWNTWAIIQDCYIPSATRSAVPITSLLFFFERHPPLSVHTVCLHDHSPSLSSQLSPFDIKALCHEPTYFASVASVVLMAIHRTKSVTLGNICRNTSWIDWARQICWQIINKTEIECSALWEGWVQPSMAGVLVLISDGRFQNPMMSCKSLLRRFPLKIKGWKQREIYLWSVSAIMMWNSEQRREVDLSNDTKLDLLDLLFARLGSSSRLKQCAFLPK